MKVILKSLKVLSILFLSIGVLTCEEDDVVLPEVVAEFTYTVNQETGVVSFINTSVNANIYSWDFGDDESSTEVNPSHVYEPGTYTVVLSARNVASPYVTYSDTITIDGSGGGGGGSCTAETTESIAAADLNITFQTNTPAVIEDNTTFSWIDNPDPSGINESCKVGQVDRANNSPFDNIQIDLADKLDFNTSEGLKMKVWSPVANTPVLLKLEEIGNPGNFVEITETTADANTWTELTYDFAPTATPQFNKMVIFFNFNVADGSTYYFDDIALYGAGGGGSCTAETTESIAAADLNITFQTNTPAIIEDNASFDWIDNPDSAGMVNTSCKVGEVVRANNSPFDNVQIDLSDKLDFNASEGLKMKVWSPVANTPVLLKLEEIGNAGNFVEILQTTGAENTWTELTYDFSPTATPQFNKMVIFFNFNVADGSTYYFDDLMVYGAGGGGGGGSFDGGLITNGDFETGAAAPWSGNAANVVDQNGNFVNEANIMSPSNPFDVNLSQALSLEANKTYELSFVAYTDDATGSRSMIAGIGEAADNFDAVTETPALTSSPQTFTYQLTVNYNDFANSRVLFDMGAETGFVFIDDVSLFCLDCGGGGGGGTCPAPPAGDFIADGDFEANADCWQLIDNGGTVTISTTVSNGGSNSGQIKTTPGSNPALKQERFGIGTIQPNTTYVVQFDIQTNANDLPANGAVFQAFAFSEPAEGSTDPAVQHILVAGDASFPSSWDTRTYTFTTAGNVGGGVSLLLELVCGGVAGCTGTVNIDNVSFTAQ